MNTNVDNSFEKSIVIFGAGKIGRSFIGQVFSQSGYHNIFIDVDQRLINELNRRRKYDVIIKAADEQVVEVDNVCGINSSNVEAVTDAIARCNLMATCVGKNVLPKIFPLLAKGIEKRFAAQPGYPIDIILAENMRDACLAVKKGLGRLLKKGFPVDSYIGLIETSIGKMVPIMPREIEEKDPLLAYAESYNTLILDKNGFKNPVPDLPELSPKENIKAWVDRKAFIHNLGHSTAAYFGAFKHPTLKYIFEVLEDPNVYEFTKEVMLQSANIIQALYQDDFSENALTTHIDDLLLRFRNEALKDTVFRVGQDRLRKLGPDDRFVGIIRHAQKLTMDYDRILKAMAYSFYFRAMDEGGGRSEEDILFDHFLSQGLESMLRNVCGFDPVNDKAVINKLSLYVKHKL